MTGLQSEREEWKLYMMVRAFAFLFMLLFGVGIYGALEQVSEVIGSDELFLSKGSYYAVAARKLLTNITSENEDYGDGSNGGEGSINRVGSVASCSKDSILVYQGATSPMPNGIPTYTVEIQNVCLSSSESCSISDIHLNCGWFSSARLVDPSIFRRISYDDCLVKDGQPVNQGETLSFQYANTFKYPLSVSSVSCTQIN